MFLYCAQIGFLSDGLVRVKLSGHAGCKVFDGKDLICGIEKFREKFFEIEPFVRSSPNSPVIKIESIDVDVSSHVLNGIKKQGPPEAAPRPGSKPKG